MMQDANDEKSFTVWFRVIFKCMCSTCRIYRTRPWSPSPFSVLFDLCSVFFFEIFKTWGVLYWGVYVSVSVTSSSIYSSTMNRSKTPITRSVSVPLTCWKCTVSSQTMIRFFSVFRPKSLQLFLLSQHIRQKGLYTGSLTISLRRYSKCIPVYDGSSGEFTIFLFPYFFIFPLLPDLFTSLLFLI